MHKLKKLRAETSRMLNELCDMLELGPADEEDSARQIMAPVAFGMIYAVGRMNQLQPPEVHALAIGCLQDVFQYASSDAVEIAETFIRAASDPAFHPTINAVIRRGIDAHAQWLQGDHDALNENLTAAFQMLGEGLAGS